MPFESPQSQKPDGCQVRLLLKHWQLYGSILLAANTEELHVMHMGVVLLKTTTESSSRQSQVPVDEDQASSLLVQVQAVEFILVLVKNFGSVQSTQI